MHWATIQPFLCPRSVSLRLGGRGCWCRCHANGGRRAAARLRPAPRRVRSSRPSGLLCPFGSDDRRTPLSTDVRPVDRGARGRRQRQQHRLARSQTGAAEYDPHQRRYGRLPRQSGHHHRNNTTDPLGRRRSASAARPKSSKHCGLSAASEPPRFAETGSVGFSCPKSYCSVLTPGVLESAVSNSAGARSSSAAVQPLVRGEARQPNGTRSPWDTTKSACAQRSRTATSTGVESPSASGPENTNTSSSARSIHGATSRSRTGLSARFASARARGNRPRAAPVASCRSRSPRRPRSETIGTGQRRVRGRLRRRGRPGGMIRAGDVATFQRPDDGAAIAPSAGASRTLAHCSGGRHSQHQRAHCEQEERDRRGDVPVAGPKVGDDGADEEQDQAG
jgi:hypothetical protein